ncbi:MAG: MFS transporter [Spirochaetia bacterium]
MSITAAETKSRYIWVIAGANMLLILLIAGSTFYSGSVFLVPLQKMMNTDRSAVSKVFAIIITVNGLMMPAAGFLIDRWGPKKMMFLGMLGLAAVFFLFSRAVSLWHLYLLALFQGLFQPVSGGIPNQSIVGIWFDKKRGRAMGLMGAGIGLGGLTIPWLLGLLIEEQGIRFAYMSVSVTILILCVPIVLFVLKDSPEKIGIDRDGMPLLRKERKKSDSGKSSTEDIITLKDAVKTVSFWAVLLSSALGLSMVGVISLHLPAILQDAGLSLSLSAGYLGMMLGIGVAGRVGVGELTDRMNPRLLFSVSLLSMGASTLLMFFPGAAPFRITFIAVFGIAQASVSTLFPLIVQRVFGTRSFGKVYGPIGLCVSFAVAGGNYLGGWIRDINGSYQPAIIITAIAGAAAFTASRFIKPPEREEKLCTEKN